MIEVENNSTVGPQNLELDVTGEDGVIYLVVTDGDTGQLVIDMTTDNPKQADQLLGDLRTAIEEAF